MELENFNGERISLRCRYVWLDRQDNRLRLLITACISREIEVDPMSFYYPLNILKKAWYKTRID